ncbi:hypothetical protein FMM80_13430 [Schaedlerella arabinosiphila]|uniref:Uncharacterized protein n=1 Tax=Schaedlerella arabinosiphila TaxID=2044587 RepID=A0A9X5C7R9_9FIRM|nr:hypothetical protein [Schaedlerella arabinosiphila]
MVRLRPFLPAGGYRTFDRGIHFFDIVGQIRVHIIRARRFRIKTKNLVEFAEYIVHNPLFVLHGKHPDAEILCLIFLTELLAGQPQKG